MPRLHDDSTDCGAEQARSLARVGSGGGRVRGRLGTQPVGFLGLQGLAVARPRKWIIAPTEKPMELSTVHG